MTFRLFTMIFTVLFFQFVTAEDTQTNHNVELEGKSEKTDENTEDSSSGWAAFPVAFYSSDTSFGGGGSAVFFRKHYSDRWIERSDSLAAVLFYTFRNQFLSATVGDLYFQEADWHIKSSLLISRFPKDFYGIGNQSSDSNHVVYTPFDIESENVFERRIYRSLYAGIITLQGYSMLVYGKNEPSLLQYYRNRKERGFISGAGFQFNRDTRNDSIYPTEGSVVSINAVFAAPCFGSEYTFSRYIADIRGYTSLPLDSVFAWQFYAEAVAGETPLNYIPEIGSKDLMRGYGMGRYKDNILTALQFEWRVPVFWRFGAVFFVSAGKVQSNMRTFIPKDIHPAWGAGIRAALTKKKKINFRFDFAFIPGGFQFYFNMLEAF